MFCQCRYTLVLILETDKWLIRGAILQVLSSVCITSVSTQHSSSYTWIEKVYLVRAYFCGAVLKKSKQQPLNREAFVIL